MGVRLLAPLFCAIMCTVHLSFNGGDILTIPIFCYVKIFNIWCPTNVLGFIHNNMLEKIKSNLSRVRFDLYLLKGTVEWQDSGVLRLSIGPLKGQCHEIFDFRFFYESVSPKPLSVYQ
jgi:hypothetical protein